MTEWENALESSYSLYPPRCVGRPSVNHIAADRLRLIPLYSMVEDKIKELAQARAKLAALEEAVASELRGELAALPTKYGFATTAAFIAAVRAASGKRRGRKPKAESTAAPKSGRKRRKRAVITDAIRADVKRLAEDGRTGSAIAKELGISLPSVQNIKKALGLVRKRAGKAK